MACLALKFDLNLKNFYFYCEEVNDLKLVNLHLLLWNRFDNFLDSAVPSVSFCPTIFQDGANPWNSPYEI